MQNVLESVHRTVKHWLKSHFLLVPGLAKPVWLAFSSVGKVTSVLEKAGQHLGLQVGCYSLRPAADALNLYSEHFKMTFLSLEGWWGERMLRLWCAVCIVSSAFPLPAGSSLEPQLLLWLRFSTLLFLTPALPYTPPKSSLGRGGDRSAGQSELVSALQVFLAHTSNIFFRISSQYENSYCVTYMIIHRYCFY